VQCRDDSLQLSTLPCLALERPGLLYTVRYLVLSCLDISCHDGCTALHYTTLHYTTLHCTALHYNAALHRVVLRCAGRHSLTRCSIPFVRSLLAVTNSNSGDYHEKKTEETSFCRRRCYSAVTVDSSMCVFCQHSSVFTALNLSLSLPVIHSVAVKIAVQHALIRHHSSELVCWIQCF
jgi:hypothetical protein